MKKLVQSVLVIMAIVVLGASASMAGHGRGPGDGTGPVHEIVSDFEYSGIVASMVRGDGLVLATGTEDDPQNVTVYGIGPYRYWENLGIDRPVVDDEITVVGKVVSYNGIERNIAYSITTDEGDTIQLRDEDGKPLWKGMRGGKTR